MSCFAQNSGWTGAEIASVTARALTTTTTLTITGSA